MRPALPEALRPVAASSRPSAPPSAPPQALDGQISYHSRRPVLARRHTTSGAEAELLITAPNALEHFVAPPSFDEEDIRARLQQAMARPATPAAPAPAPPTAHDETHRQTLTPNPGTPGIHGDPGSEYALLPRRRRVRMIDAHRSGSHRLNDARSVFATV
ncbi:hypothetical protein ACIRPQ_21705 [Streptomyces sp. NPDC101213]|uniref:hypothetical protein n=1 Tax=Streptomyces sp. NPDC101213 TaxID=3366130 RepID=UPI00382FD018